MPAVQLTRITQEVTYGVYPGTPAAGTQIDMFMPVGNANTVLPQPQFWSIRDAGVGNRVVKKNVGWTGVGGAVQSYLFPSQAAFFVNLAAGLTGTAPCTDLPSFTVDRLIYLEDGSCGKSYNRFVGCKFTDFTLSCDNSDQGCLVMMKGSIVGSQRQTITSADFAVPALSAYPGEDPYLFYETAGNLTIGSSRTNYESLEIAVKNSVKPLRDESRYASRVTYFGRDVTFSAKLLYKTQADRAAFEAGTKQAVSVKFDNGTDYLELNLGGVCNIDDLNDDLPLDDYFWQDISLSALVDPNVGTDLTITSGTDS